MYFLREKKCKILNVPSEMLMGGHEYFQSAGLSTFLAMANIKLFLTSLTCNSRHFYMLNVMQRFARGGKNASIIRTKGKKEVPLIVAGES